MSAIYLAARYGRREEALGLRQLLEAAGHVVTSRWVLEDQAGRPDVELAQQGLLDLLAADVLVALTDGEGRPGAWAGGRHVELGMALAWNRRVIILGGRENVFHHLPSVELASDVTDLFVRLCSVCQQKPSPEATSC